MKARRFAAMTEQGLAGARALCEWKARVAAAWPAVKIESASDVAARPIRAGQEIGVTADVFLGELTPGDVIVEAYYGRLRGDQAIREGAALALRPAGELGGGRYRFEGTIPAQESGEHAFAVRVVPHNGALPNPFATRLLAWQ